MDIQGVLYSVVPSGVTPDAYMFIKMHLLRCPVVFQPLFNQTFWRLSPCDIFFAGKRTGEAVQATVENQTSVITAKIRQTVDEIHVPQRISTVGERQNEDQARSRESLSLLYGLHTSG